MIQGWKIIMAAKEPRVKVPREPRREMNAQPALMTIGSKQCECVVLDVSPGGAKIMTDVAIDVAMLVLSVCMFMPPPSPLRNACRS